MRDGLAGYYVTMLLMIVSYSGFAGGMKLKAQSPLPEAMFLLVGWHWYWQWLQNTIASIVQSFLLKILAAGPIPKHIAFVMDGNRRYARLNHKEVQQGHRDGFTALRRVSRDAQVFGY